MAPARNYDNAGIYEDEGYLIFGTKSQADAAIAALPGIDQSFNFDFTKENMLWSNGNSRLIKESAGWTLYLDPHTDGGQTSYQAKMQSPSRAWNPADFSAINLEIACFNTTSLKLEAQKHGKDSENDFYKEFSVQSDGQFHVVSVPIAGNWTEAATSGTGSLSGLIAKWGFSAGSGTQPNAKVIIKKIWKS